jgi:hypothetical protein
MNTIQDYIDEVLSGRPVAHDEIILAGIAIEDFRIALMDRIRGRNCRELPIVQPSPDPIPQTTKHKRGRPRKPRHNNIQAELSAAAERRERLLIQYSDKFPKSRGWSIPAELYFNDVPFRERYEAPIKHSTEGDLISNICLMDELVSPIGNYHRCP